MRDRDFQVFQIPVGEFGFQPNNFHNGIPIGEIKEWERVSVPSGKTLEKESIPHGKI
jgi:hypothetical protein